MTTSVTKIGGVMVVTQVIAQDDKSIQLQPADASQTPAVTVQAPPPAKHSPPPSPPPKVDDTTATFLRGEPQGLGVVQVMVGLLCCLFSLTAIYQGIMIVHAPFCLAIFFVVSGALTLAAVRRTSVGLVWACLVMNAISVLISVVGVAYTCVLLAYRPPRERFCDRETWSLYDPTDAEVEQCLRDMNLLNVTVYGCLGLLLVLLVLQVCVTVTSCVFSAKAIRRRSRYAPMLVEVDRSGLGSDVSLLDSEGGETSPPYSP